ncbi:MAG: hypothetical protein SGPRY_007482 [Prymnesium sp.]
MKPLRAVPGNKKLYQRCAVLLLQLEQCVVYGAYNSVNTLSGHTDELMGECVHVATGAQSTKAVQSNDQVKNRVLYYYLNEDPSSLNTPRGAMSLSDAQVAVPKHPSYPWYFTVQCKLSGQKLALQANSGADMALWMRVLESSTALPAPPGVASKEQMEFIKSLPEPAKEASARRSFRADLSQKMAVFFKSSKGSLSQAIESSQPLPTVVDSAEVSSEVEPEAVSLLPKSGEQPDSAQVYEIFNAQRDLIRGLTNLADDLRLVDPAEREAGMHEGLTKIPVSKTTYYPLGKSTSEMLRVLRFAGGEGVVFNTKARCPLMLFLEVKKTERPISDVVRTASAVEDFEPQAVVPTINDSSELNSSSRKREPWSEKEARIKAKSELGSVQGWGLTSMIVKSNDDLRQEVFIMQVISFFKKIFPPDITWLNCYEIQARQMRPLHCLPQEDTRIRLTPSGGLSPRTLHTLAVRLQLRRSLKPLQLFITRYGPVTSDKFKVAQNNFAKSLAAYSVVMWVLMLRDRHNGNLMIDSEGHYFHIDFGFVLGHSTGKQIGGMVECSPFKLTPEYLELLDGVGSPIYDKFCDACTKAMVACREHGETICTMIEIVGTHSVFPCFGVVSLKQVIKGLQKRLFMHLEVKDVDAAFRKTIQLTAGHWGSRWYDKFQHMQRGIAV